MYKMVLETMSSIKQTEAGKRKGDRNKKTKSKYEDTWIPVNIS